MSFRNELACLSSVSLCHLTISTEWSSIIVLQRHYQTYSKEWSRFLGPLLIMRMALEELIQSIHHAPGFIPDGVQGLTLHFSHLHQHLLATETY